MKINCSDCVMYNTQHCDDCLVTAVLHPPADGVELDPELDPPLSALADAGLIPVLRFRPRAGAPGTEIAGGEPAKRSRGEPAERARAREAG